MTREHLLTGLAEDLVSLKRRMMGPSAPVRNHPTRAQIGLLFAIAHQDSLGVKELAGRFCMTPSAATQLIDGLVREKLLSRTTHPDDRRRVHLALTAKGKAKLAGIKKKHLASLSRLFASLSASELSELRRLLRKAIDHLA